MIKLDDVLLAKKHKLNIRNRIYRLKDLIEDLRKYYCNRIRAKIRSVTDDDIVYGCGRNIR